jgi:hypothetical protein
MKASELIASIAELPRRHAESGSDRVAFKDDQRLVASVTLSDIE